MVDESQSHEAVAADGSHPLLLLRANPTIYLFAFHLRRVGGTWQARITNSAAAEVCEESIPGLRIDHVDISGLPLLNTDLEIDGGFPPAVEAFRDKVRQADCFLFGSPEYNYSIATPLKNALDWASRGKNCWADKPAAIVSAGGGFGGGRSQYHLRQVGVFLDLHFINKPELFVKAFEQPPKFDSDGNLIDADIRERIKQVLLSLQAFTLRLQKED